MVAPVPSQTKVTTPYGKKGSAWSTGYHTGVDFAAPAGRAVVAARPGIVEIKSQAWAGPNLVIVNVGGGQKDIYGHMRSRSVSAGDRVQAGQKLGEVGTMGNSTGNHLHFEVQINGKSVNPAGAISWREGQILPPPIEGIPDSGVGSTTGVQGAANKGDFDKVRALIDIDSLRSSTLFNPPMWDGQRLPRMYKAQEQEGMNWWKEIHGKGFGRGWIVRDPAALEGVGNLDPHDHYKPTNDETGEEEPLAEGVTQDKVINISQYQLGEKYGFRFLMNPSTNQETYSSAAGVDIGGFLTDVARADAPPVVVETGVRMSVNLLLDRQMDHKMFSMKGSSDATWLADFYEHIIRDEDMEGLHKYGTAWDLEYLFRCVNGNPPSAPMWHGRITSDFGILVPYPIIISIGDGPGVRRIRGSIMGATFKHTMFAPGMIPIRTNVTLSIRRHSDSWYTNEHINEENKDDSAGGTPDPDTFFPGGGGVVEKPPQPGSPKPTGTRAQNIEIAKPIFGTYRTKYGWNDEDWNALIKLWDGESNWNHLAKNPDSNATGIPQAVPYWHPDTNNDAWRKSPAKQIAWGLEYIRVKSAWSGGPGGGNNGKPYGRPKVAYDKWLARKPHWY